MMDRSQSPRDPERLINPTMATGQVYVRVEYGWVI